jgi:hypothetical protein
MKTKHLETKARITKIVEELRASGILPRLSGQCLASSDIVQNMLDDNGIQAKIVECKLSIYTRSADGNDSVHLVGYDCVANNSPMHVDTHAVVVTVDERPILIDLSIGELLPQGHGYVLDYVDSLDPDVIAKYAYGETTLTYRPKSRTRFPPLHQKTLLERIRSEMSLRNTLQLMKILVTAGLALSGINFFLNVTNLYLKLM